jgi:serine/threonine-protein kinase
MTGILKRLGHYLIEAAQGDVVAPDARWWRDTVFGHALLEHPSCALNDRYVIEREVGRGGMAVVFLATDRRYGRQVAVKVLRPDRTRGMSRRRFLREIRLAAQLMHPHILPVYDSGEAAGLLYFVMPYAEGGSLRTRLRRERRIALGETLQLVREVAGALDYAHRRQIVHRDVKPENILFHQGVAMVADFGIGKVMHGSGEEFPTGSNSLMGTIPYMSPEQIDGERGLDGRSDLYSVGCVLCEMLTGESVFTGPTPQAVLARRVTHPVPKLALPDEIPTKVRSVIRSLLAVAPTERPASGAEMLQMLGHATTCRCHLCGTG